MTRAQLTTALLLVTVICLGLSALLIPARADRATVAVALTGFPPSQVVTVEIATPDGQSQRLDRVAPDQWRLSLPVNGSQTRWPASPERVRAFLRILDRLRGTAADESEVSSKPGPTITITSELGDTTTIELPAGSLGGRAMVRVTPGGPEDPAPSAFVTTDELSRLFGPDGMLPWLDARAFAGLDGQVGGVGVTSLGGTMTLTRAGASWRLESPFAAQAEPSLLAELIESLQTLPIASPSTEVGIPGPDATTITLTTTTRAASPDGSIVSSSASHTLRTLGAVSQSGQVPVVLESVAEDGSPIAGPLAATIDAARLAEIVRQPNFYIARRASNASPTDVRSLVVVPVGGQPVELARADRGWMRDASPVSAQDAAAIDALVSLLTQAAAVQAQPAGAIPADAQPLATLTARGLGGLTIAECELAVAPLPGPGPESRAHALLLSNGIARYFSPEAAVDAVRWVAGLPTP